MDSSDKRLSRLQVMLADDELRALDDWRFSQRMPSRAAAVRELLRRGLAAEGYIGKAGITGDSRSFSVVKNSKEDGSGWS